MTDTTTNPHSAPLVLGGNELDFGPGLSRLLVHIWRSLAKGQPIPPQQINAIADDIGLAKDEANSFLQRVSERDADGNLVGIMGLSLNDHPHHFTVDGVELRTWCAGDTLFLPAMLERTAVIESASPLSGDLVRLTVSPEGIVSSDPAGAALSVPAEDPGQLATAELATIWSTFCHQVFLFPSTDEGQRWAADRDNIAIHPVEDAYQFVTALWRKIRAHADQALLSGKDQS